MRIGCCTGSFSSLEDPVGKNVLPLLKCAGYDYAELPLCAVMELSEEEFQELLNVVTASGTPVEACNSFFPGSLRLTGPDRAPSEITAYLKKAFQRIAQLGVKRLVFGSGGAKNIPEGYDPATAYEEIVAVLREAAGYAEKTDCTIVIEPLNHGEANIIFTTSDGALLVQSVNHPRVCLLVDYYHYALEGELLLPPAAALLEHCHFADPDGRCYPLEWKQSFTDFFHLLERYGYRGRVSVEASAKRGNEDLFAFPALMRKALD